MILKVKADSPVYAKPHLSEETLRYVNSTVLEGHWHILVMDSKGCLHDIPARHLEGLTKLEEVLK